MPKIPVTNERPRFERIALLLQGGGALGSYQAGVYEALAEANLHPDWVAGISIGAINAALIAGNPAEKRVERLRDFWETVSQSPFGVPYLRSLKFGNGGAHQFVNELQSLGTVFGGRPGFFTPRLPPFFLHRSDHVEALSFYDIAPLKATLKRLVDFDLINTGTTRLSVGAVNVCTGNLVYFDSTTHWIAPEHIIASGSLPPGFPATVIDGEPYWDGGLISNTTLQWVLDSQPRDDTLAFQVDVWSARGEFPGNLIEQDLRQKEDRFSSRTRYGTDHFLKLQKLRRAAAKLIPQLPECLRRTAEAELFAAEADEKVYNIIHLIYRSKHYEDASRDYEFSRRTMEEHWSAGYNDAIRTLRHPEVLRRPESADGVFTFDLARDGRE
jgi:NTE family protein